MTADKQDTWTIRRVLDWTREEFQRRKLDSPRLDAELLLGHALGLTRMQLYLDLERPLSPVELSSFRALVKRRTAREPISQIVGEREFWGRAFMVSADVLTPRPDTELIIEDVLSRLKTHPIERPAVLDVGTGSGCLAVTLALEVAGATVTALDISERALAIARANAKRHAANVSFLRSDLDAALPAEASFDLVVSNPPYLTEEEWREAGPEVREHEPREALVGEDADGLGHHRRMARQIWPRVRHGMWVELGWKQGPGAVESWQRAVGTTGEVVLLKDLEKRDRVVRIVRAT